MDARVVPDVPPARADELVALYDTTEWWADRDVDAVARAVENATVVVGLELRDVDDSDGDGADGVVENDTRADDDGADGDRADGDGAGGAVDDGGLVASARVVSDGVYYARIYDVVVHADYRGEGLGERLVRETVEHPHLADLDAITLGCEPGLVAFYEDCGFEEPPVEFRQLNYGD